MVKNSPTNAGDARDAGSIPGPERSPGAENGQPTPVILPGKSHGQRSLEGLQSIGLQRVRHNRAAMHAQTREEGSRGLRLQREGRQVTGRLKKEQLSGQQTFAGPCRNKETRGKFHHAQCARLFSVCNT